MTEDADVVEYRPWLLCFRCRRNTRHRHVNDERVYVRVHRDGIVAGHGVDHWRVVYACTRCSLERTWGTIEGPRAWEQDLDKPILHHHTRRPRPHTLLPPGPVVADVAVGFDLETLRRKWKL